jgi:hypothetical protein
MIARACIPADSQGKKQDPTSKITRTKRVEVWLKTYSIKQRSNPSTTKKKKKEF